MRLSCHWIWRGVLGIQEAEVTNIREVQPGAFLLSLQAEGISKGARPGQFYMIRVQRGEDPFLPRPFSWLRNHAEGQDPQRDRGNGLQILFQVVGKGTCRLSELTPGRKLLVQGPLGMGWRWEGVERPVLIGGGIGAASLLPLLDEFPLELKENAIVLLGARSPRSLWLSTQMRGTPARVMVAVEEGEADFKGTVVDLLLAKEKEITSFPGVQFFVCGPRAMLGKIAKVASNRKIPCQVSLEVSMACGRGVCLGCAVKVQERERYYMACKEGPVFDAQALDWSDEEW